MFYLHVKRKKSLSSLERYQSLSRDGEKEKNKNQCPSFFPFHFVSG